MTTVHEPLPETPRGGFFAPSVVRLIGLWILAGALFKLLYGTPSDLPPVVREFPFPADLGLKYKAAIGIELCIVTFALLKPRWGWVPVALQLLVFVAVLVLTLGEPSCGCFGQAITMPPWLMLLIDGALLVTLAAVRPWRRIRGRGLPLVVLVFVCAAGIAAPWFLDRELDRPGTITEDGRDVVRPYVIFELADWVGKDIGETDFAKVYEDPYSLPPDGLWVFWRSTCDHCAEHLGRLEREDDGSRMITLIRLHEPHDTLANQVVHEMPAGPHVVHVDLPDTVHYVISTPGELEMEAYVVVAGREAVGADAEGEEDGGGEKER